MPVYFNPATKESRSMENETITVDHNLLISAACSQLTTFYTQSVSLPSAELIVHILNNLD